MKNPLRSATTLLLAACAAGPLLHAAALPNRLNRDSARTALQDMPQGVSPRVRSSKSLGHLNGDARLESMALVLAPSAAQSAALNQLLADQQNPASPRYHQWLTPAEFGAQFGVSDSDLQVLQNWLTNQGFQVTDVAPSRNRITFSGTSAGVEAAFRTEIDRFSRNGEQFFENSTAPQIPAALQNVVGAITGLSSFRPRPALHRIVRDENGGLAAQHPNANTAGGSHYIAPYDFRQIYNANGLFNSGFTGAGVKIAVLGQSAVDLNQITYFQQLTGQTPKAPTLVLVPGTGTATAYQGDETESEADLEYASGVAPGATIYFVYVGNSTTYNNNNGASVADALNYAITNNIAPILTYSYGGCETANSNFALTGQEGFFRQANAQGQTILAASGDTGAAGCDYGVTTAYDGLQVGYPASSPYVTAIGGTSFTDTTTPSSYWSGTNNSQYGSAIGYIPETTWNENSTDPLAGSGGGASRYFGKPNWQTGTGVPADNARDIPDISFSAAEHDAYLVCTSDSSYINSSGATAACTPTAFGIGKVGGTSLPTPAFAGALAMVLNANNRASGLGNLNPSLYSLAATNPSVFHDITTGNNIAPCAAGTIGCVNGTLGYNAAAGYDLATGLGSLDIGAFSLNITSGVTATAKVPTLELTPIDSTVEAILLNVSISGNGTIVPTGSVTATVDGGGTINVPLGNASAPGSVGLSFLGRFAVGNHTVVVSYPGDANFSAVSGSLVINVPDANGGLTLAASPNSITINSSTAHAGAWTLNLTSTNGYSGLVILNNAVAASGSALPASGCLIGQGDAGISGNATITTTLTYSYSASDCAGSNVFQVFGRARTASSTSARVNTSGKPHSDLPLLAVGFTGLLGSAFLRRKRAWMTGLLALAAMAGTAGLSGCGSGSTPLPGGTTGGNGTTTGGSGTTSVAPKGTYNLVLSGTDYPRRTISASVNVTLVIQ